ncbi:MAG: DUF1801 domain-containing protein [Acidimicrobiia bacterium]|jgi:hypothetical protein
MAELKTTRNDADVDEYLHGVDNQTRRRDALAIRDLMAQVTGEKPEMWGDSIVGFGPYAYRPKSGGAEHEWFKVGFAPRKQALTLYIMDGFDDYDALLSKLGPHSTGKSCLYIKNLEKVDTEVLTELVKRSVAHVEARIAD